MLDKIKGGIKMVAAGIKQAKIIQAKAKALSDDTDLDGKPQWQNIKERLPRVIEKGKEFFSEAKELSLLCLELFIHVWNAVEEDEAKK